MKSEERRKMRLLFWLTWVTGAMMGIFLTLFMFALLRALGILKC